MFNPQENRPKNLFLKIFLPIILSTVIILAGFFAIHFDFKALKFTFGDTPADSDEVSSEIIDLPDSPNLETISKVPQKMFKCTTLTPGIDYLTDDTADFEAICQEITTIIANIKADKFNSINFVLNYKNGLICESEGFKSPVGDVFGFASSLAKQNGLKIFVTVNLGALCENDITNRNDIEKICRFLSSDIVGKNADMLIFSGYSPKAPVPYSDYAASGRECSYAEYQSIRINSAMKEFYCAVLQSNSELYTGIMCGKESADAFNEYYNITDWFEGGYADFALIFNDSSTEAKNEPKFNEVIDDWSNNLSSITDVHYMLCYSNVNTDADGWKKTDQIVNQLMTLSNRGIFNFVFDSYISFYEDKTESKTAVQKFLNGEISSDYVLRALNVTSPTKTKYTTYEETALLMGASDPEFELTLNGQPVERNELGYFSLNLNLELGKNVFTLKHKGVSTTYTITYKKLVIKSYSPTEKLTLEGGSTIVVSAVAISGSEVTATFNGKKITLTEEPILDDDGNPTGEYSNFKGSFTAPTVYDEDKSLGKITIKAESKYGTETGTSGNMTVKKSERPVTPNPSPPLPEGGHYIDVDTGLIAEVVLYQAETFNPEDEADFSRPTNNYLPKGTVDYCKKSTINYKDEVLKTLRYGKSVYTTHKGVDNIKVYEGVLPDHNELNVAGFDGSGRHSVLTLDVMWKAPFMLELKDQKYVNEGYGSNRDYHLVNNTPTFSYIDITFCYSTVLTGELTIPEDNKLFSKAEWIKNELDYTLRLYLKKVGAFYGWTAEYNDKGQLEFYFLNPATITEADNKYGYSLDGITVMLNVGHGGSDPGALGPMGENSKFNEAKLNLILANKVKAELESIGAKVLMDRTDNTSPINDDDRMIMIHEQKPDYVLAIHRNSYDATTRGFRTYFFNAYSYKPTTYIYNKTKEANLYVKNNIGFHLYFLSRVSTCPVVLTENGFISNVNDYSDMIQDDFNAKCAVALTKGIIEHFKSINQ